MELSANGAVCCSPPGRHPLMNQLASSQAQTQVRLDRRHMLHARTPGLPGFFRRGISSNRMRASRHSQDQGEILEEGLDHRAASARSWTFVVGVVWITCARSPESSSSIPAGRPPRPRWCTPSSARHAPHTRRRRPKKRSALVAVWAWVPTNGPPKVKSEKAKGPRSEGGPWWREGPSSSVTG